MKKKLIMAAVLALALVCLLAIGISSAENVASGTCGDKLTWILDSKGTLTISGTGKMTNFSSTSEVPWYAKRKSIKQVVIKGGVTSVGSYAFYDCKNMTEIEIPESVVEFGKTSYYTNGDVYGYNCERIFYGCDSLKSIVIPSDITHIGDYMFYGCEYLTSIDLPDGVTSIGRGAFAACTGLKSIEIPSDITEISDYTFSSCTGLTSIDLPDGVTRIGDAAFSGCTSLTSIDIPDGVTGIGDAAFSSCTSLTSIVLPDGVTWIGESAFSRCTSLTSIDLPDGVTSIKMRAFYECTGLTSIVLPDGVTSIKTSTFYGCTNLTSIDIPDGVTSIEGYAFEGCTSLTSIDIPDGVTRISDSAFYGCDGLTSIDLPDGVTSIGEHAFYGCDGLTSIDLPDGVTSIGRCAFYSCSSLTSIDLPNGLKSIGNHAFYNCDGLTSIDIPDGVTRISDSAFEGCDGLTSIDLPDGVTSIGEYAFYNCDGLTSIDLPDGVTSIGDYALSQCPNLTIYGYTGTTAQTYANANNIPFIALDAVTNAAAPLIIAQPSGAAYTEEETADALTVTASTVKGTLTYQWYENSTNSNEGGTAIEGATAASYTPSTAAVGTKYYYVVVTNTDDEATGNVTASVTSEVVAIVVEEVTYSGTCGENLTWELSDDGTLTISGTGEMDNWSSSDPAPWYEYRSLINTVVVDDGVSSIGYYAFYLCKLTQITLSDSVTTIGGSAFESCSSLKSITIPDSVTEIGSFAFYYCWSLEKVVLSKNLDGVRQSTFYECRELTQIDIPEGLQFISSDAFALSGLKSINIPSTVTSLDLDKCYYLESITVDNNNTTYLSDEFGVLYTKDKIELIKYPSKALHTEYTVPESVANIRSFAFANCNNLVKLTFLSSITDIEPSWGGFPGGIYGCTNLTIYGYTSSTAEAYANSNSIPFVAFTNAAAPTITAQPVGATYTVGNAANALTVTATTTKGTLTYQWYENETNSNSGGDAITGATAANYTPDTAVVGTKYYYVVVTNTDNEATGKKSATVTSKTAAVTVNAKTNAATPTIIEQPIGATYTLGDEAALLRVSASCTGGELTYQWYKNNINSNTGGTLLPREYIDSYCPSTANVGTTYYYVIVTNTDDDATGKKTASVASDAVAITVNEPPQTSTHQLSGQITSWMSSARASIQLLKKGVVVTEVYDQSSVNSALQNTTYFTITDVPDGTYDLVITKGGHLPYTIQDIVVDGADVDLTLDPTKSYSDIQLIPGDINGDGCIDLQDLIILTSSNNYGKAAPVVKFGSDVNIDAITVELVDVIDGDKEAIYCSVLIDGVEQLIDIVSVYDNNNEAYVYLRDISWFRISQYLSTISNLEAGTKLEVIPSNSGYRLITKLSW